MELELLTAVPAALADGSISAWFQPLIDTGTGEVRGWGALGRWPHPVHGMVPPDVPLPLAAATGNMAELTRHMLADAASSSLASRPPVRTTPPASTSTSTRPRRGAR
jgi:predicted signal transduction protein with EAL and GGDEF domain